MPEGAGDSRELPSLPLLDDGAAGGSSPPERPLETVTPGVLERWNCDVSAMEESIGLTFRNDTVAAERRLEAACAVVSARTIDFAGGDHDLRGTFTLLRASLGLLNGVLSMESNQLDIVIKRVWEADELLAQDGDWAGKNVLRGLCLLIAGVAQAIQGSGARGVWQILRSWLFLRSLQSEGLNFEGHERSVVRSTALLALGAFNIFRSLLPPQAMKAAGWLTGFQGGRDEALDQLWTCFDERGIQAPFAGVVLITFAVDVSSFIGELWSERKPKFDRARQVLDWAAERYPGAVLFEVLQAAYLAAVRDLEGALEILTRQRELMEDVPAFLFLLSVRIATLEVSRFNWSAAAAAFRAAFKVHQDVGRRAFVPTLAMNAHLCCVAAGEHETAASMLEISRSYRNEKKKWSFLDVASLKWAETAHVVAAQQEGADADGATEPWRPMTLLYMKIGIQYRSGSFMTPDRVSEFLAMLRAEAESCADDAANQCLCFAIQAETLRQNESWNEALKLAGQGLSLKGKLSAQDRTNGALQFCQLVAAQALYALGKAGAAKEALGQLDNLDADHFFQKQVDFKATHLRKLVGAVFKDTYTEVQVAGRSKSRLTVDIPQGVEHVEWDWIIADFTINFTALFVGVGSAEPRQLQRVDQHAAESGPCVGTLEEAGPGRLELVFDNSFSFLRGKVVQLRVQPSSLRVTLED